MKLINSKNLRVIKLKDIFVIDQSLFDLSNNNNKPRAYMLQFISDKVLVQYWSSKVAAGPSTVRRDSDKGS